MCEHYYLTQYIIVACMHTLTNLVYTLLAVCIYCPFIFLCCALLKIFVQILDFNTKRRYGKKVIFLAIMACDWWDTQAAHCCQCAGSTWYMPCFCISTKKMPCFLALLKTITSHNLLNLAQRVDLTSSSTTSCFVASSSCHP